MRTVALGIAVLSWLLPAFACGRMPVANPDPPEWRLAYPPEVADRRYPKGFHLVRAAPLAEWRAEDGFPSEEECKVTRLARLDAAIDRARADHGDDAKYELSVRRAVNARCVRRGELEP